MSVSRPHPWSDGPRSRPVVLGVDHDQNPVVVRAAARISAAMRTGLVCVWVDGSRTIVSDEPGALITTPLDPDETDEAVVAAERAMIERLSPLLVDAGVSWQLRYVVGEVVHGLAAVAEEVDACVIAVGTRRPGISGWMNELIGGSVAGRLAHSQLRPVLVVPQRRPGDGPEGGA
ncbi:universal stress protein family protein [Mumia flava]|uniref:Universal stress protein family protein n=1 Tax=Mumia flava TaxID=1348852 RepID=A0A2M9B7Q5_9ACTN|nr:universal stress protein [Mumia flava]PJJ53958.1 universal stress protein family protein [Mumia flava]